MAENNKVKMVGMIMEEFAFNHAAYGKNFYRSVIAVQRLSGAVDCIPITVSDNLIDIHDEWSGKNVKILGTFRSYNKHTETGNHLILSVYVEEIEMASGDLNEIYLEGYICKPTIYRAANSGRKITDLLIAVHRTNYRSDYIPIICWGAKAMIASEMKVGDHIYLHGRIQSREYPKRLEDGEVEKRTAYEVSAYHLDYVVEGLQNE